MTAAELLAEIHDAIRKSGGVITPSIRAMQADYRKRTGITE